MANKRTRTILTATQETEMLKLHKKGGLNRQQLADQFHCSTGKVGAVIASTKGKTKVSPIWVPADCFRVANGRAEINAAYFMG